MEDSGRDPVCDTIRGSVCCILSHLSCQEGVSEGRGLKYLLVRLPLFIIRWTGSSMLINHWSNPKLRIIHTKVTGLIKMTYYDRDPPILSSTEKKKRNFSSFTNPTRESKENKDESSSYLITRSHWSITLVTTKLLLWWLCKMSYWFKWYKVM